MTPVGSHSIRITNQPLSVQDAVEFVRDEAAGAVNVFIGTTRRFTAHRETVSLSYEAYDEMALNEMHRLAAECTAGWPIVRIALHHRTGTVAVGEASVVIAVSSAHRDAAFEACRFLIERLKNDVPIWKRELFSDGTEEWVKPAG
jgi:molybdopterin synthase catalytic subunit